MVRDRGPAVRRPEVAMDYVRLLFSFRGRLNRARFLVVQLALLTCWLIVSFHVASQPDIWDLLAFLVMIWINLATMATRLHDRDRNGWWAPAFFIFGRLSYAYYGLFLGLSFGVDISIAKELLLVLLFVALAVVQTGIFIELFFMPGTDGRNRFGPDPLASGPTDRHPGQNAVPGFLVQHAGASSELLRG
jgi:uncharacterized membrane protein YhaH (DUF805 family)